MWVLLVMSHWNNSNECLHFFAEVRKKKSGPSCSKLTMSLVNDSLQFTSSDMQICWNILLKKMWVAFAVQKLLKFFFSAQNIRILCIESTKTVNEMTLNELIKLTMLWTTGPWIALWSYHIYLKHWDRQAWAKSADPDHMLQNTIHPEF